MKKIIFKISLIALFLNVISCQDGLDDNSQGYNTSVYMAKNNATVVMDKVLGGEVEIESRLASPATKDEVVTISVEDFLKEYNKENATKYKMLPTQEYELYEATNPSNVSTNGKISVRIKAGQVSSKLKVKVKSLDSEVYPLGIKYAIPLSIVSASTQQILSNRKVVIDFSRPVITSVAHIKRGYAPKIILDPTIKETEEFTLQAHFMFDKFVSYQSGAINMSMISFSGGWYSRINSGDVNLADTVRESGKEGVTVNTKKWHQVTYVRTKDHRVKIYLDGELIRTFIRPNIVLKGDATISIFGPERSYSTSHILREVRVWNKALNEAQIKADLYSPVDPNSDGLIAYLPIDSPKNGYNDITKYNNKVQLYKGTSYSDYGIQDGEGFRKIVTPEEYGIDKWYDNVEFPEGKLN